jgi:hypothetical protein
VGPEGAVRIVKRVLCLGRKGDMRSAALAYLLKLRGHDAIAVGMRTMGRDTRKMMLDWADEIVLLHEKCGEGVPREYWPKLRMWEVGRDVYSKRFHDKLIKMLEAHIERDGF